MSEELIQWPRAVYWTKTYNPMVGCQSISPACDNCYARAWADRFNVSFEPHMSTRTKPPRSGICFCGNVTDLFGDWNLVHEDGCYYHRVCDYIAETLGHDKTNPYKDKATYLWLTKRTWNLMEVLKDGGWEYNRDYWTHDADTVDFCDCDLSNHYFGITTENQEWFDRRYHGILKNQAPEYANYWISAEPLLGPIDMKLSCMVSKPNTVIVGCESGRNRRFCDLKWITNIVDQCREVNVPVFVKQLCLESGKFTNKIEEFPKHLQIRQLGWL